MASNPDRVSYGWGLWPSDAEKAERALRKRAYLEQLPRGMIAAINAARWRVPADAPPEAAALADQAMQTIADVMAGKITGHAAQTALAAARMIREEVCGPPTRSLKVEGKVGLATLLVEMEGLEEGSPRVGLGETARPDAIESEIVPQAVPEEIEASEGDSESHANLAQEKSDAD